MPIEHPYIFVYQTICGPNGKSYIGVHATSNLKDGYIGGGIVNQKSANNKTAFHNAVRKYGYTSFRRYILSFYDTYEEALEEERYLVNEEWVKKNDNYNSALGGRGNPMSYMTEDQKKDFWIKRSGVNHPRYGKKALNAKKVLQYNLSGELLNTFESASEAAKFIGENVTNISKCCLGKYGQCRGYIFRYEFYTDSEKEKLSVNLSKRQRIYKGDGSWEMSEMMKEQKRNTISWMKGKKHSEESKRKMAEAKLGKKRKPHSEETKRKIGLANRKKINNGL
jgi:hypothetical protein